MGKKLKIKIITSINKEGKKGIFIQGMPIEDQKKLMPSLRKMKYQVNLILKDGSKKFMYVDDEKYAKEYIKSLGATILKIIKI